MIQFTSISLFLSSHLWVDILPPDHGHIFHNIRTIHNHWEGGNDHVACWLLENAAFLLREKYPRFVIHERTREVNQIAMDEASRGHHSHVVFHIGRKPRQRRDLHYQPLCDSVTLKDLFDPIETSSVIPNVTLVYLHLGSRVTTLDLKFHFATSGQVLHVYGTPSTGHFHASFRTIDSDSLLFDVYGQFENNL